MDQHQSAEFVLVFMGDSILSSTNAHVSLNLGRCTLTPSIVTSSLRHACSALSMFFLAT